MRPRRRKAGFTLLETTVSVAVFSVVGYALVGAIGMGQTSQRLVMRGASSNRQLRESNTVLMDELSMSNTASLVVTTLPDGNHEVDFMLPIDVGGNAAWGISDPVLGTNENWRVRYTVQAVPAGFGLNRRLLRQILDDAGEIVDASVMAEGLQDGQKDPPGFSVVQTGDVLEVSITVVGHRATTHGKEMGFHVRTRN